jgi:dihydrofolate reductase
MRKIVFQMMTTLNGRLDDPLAWVNSVGEDQYRAIDQLYDGYDTVLVGRTTYEEMAAYWPGALTEAQGTETNQVMAGRMHAYRKLVFSKSGGAALTPWNNVEQVAAETDEALRDYLVALKGQVGKDIHLSGGSSFARSVIGLGLVDEYHFFVYPTISPGAPWYAQLPGGGEMALLGTDTFENGVVALHYGALRYDGKARPERFLDLI